MMTGSNMKLLVVIICTTIICVACEQEYEVQEVSSVELFCESNSDCVVRMCGCDWVALPEKNVMQLSDCQEITEAIKCDFEPGPQPGASCVSQTCTITR